MQYSAFNIFVWTQQRLQASDSASFLHCFVLKISKPLESEAALFVDVMLRRVAFMTEVAGLFLFFPACKSGILRTFLSDETVSMGFGITVCCSAWEKLLPSSQCLTFLPRLLSVQPLTQRCRFLAQTARQCEREISCWGDPSACCFLIVDNAFLKLFIGSKTLKSAAVSATDLAPELPTLVSCSCLLSYLSVYFNT